MCLRYPPTFNHPLTPLTITIYYIVDLRLPRTVFLEVTIHKYNVFALLTNQEGSTEQEVYKHPRDGVARAQHSQRYRNQRTIR